MDPSDGGAGGGYASVRGAYESLGAEGFYAAHGAVYHNPHEKVLVEGVSMALDQWEARHGFSPFAASKAPVRVLDLACGGGEATVALEACLRRRADCLLPEFDACDPYTAECYRQRTGRTAHDWSFADVASGVLQGRPRYDVVVASFCLHLLDGPSLDRTLTALARSARYLLVASPHRRLVIEPSTGWDECTPEVVHHDRFADTGSARHRVRIRMYSSSQLTAQHALLGERPARDTQGAPRDPVERR